VPATEVAAISDPPVREQWRGFAVLPMLPVQCTAQQSSNQKRGVRERRVSTYSLGRLSGTIGRSLQGNKILAKGYNGSGKPRPTMGWVIGWIVSAQALFHRNNSTFQNNDRFYKT
jgi:hypothetical protein